MRRITLASVLLLASCFGATEETPPGDPPVGTGVVRLITGTAGIGTDTNGYMLNFHDSVFAVGATDTQYVSWQADTNIGITLDGIDGPCRIHDYRLKNVMVRANDTVTIQWQVDCGIITAYGNHAIGPAFIDFEIVTGRTSAHLAYNLFPQSWDFSPDGHRIATSVFVGGNATTLYLLGLTTSDSIHVATVGKRNDSPAWSPDGQQVRFMSGDDSTGYEMLSVGPAGAGANPVAGVSGYLSALQWSRQGDRMAYAAGSQLFVMNADGSDAHPIATAPYAWMGTPDWSPSGDSIVYTTSVLTDTTLATPLFIVATAGGVPVQLTHPAPWDSDYSPTWSRDGRYIAYIHQTGNELTTKKIVILDLTDGSTQEIPYPPGMFSIRWHP